MIQQPRTLHVRLGRHMSGAVTLETSPKRGDQASSPGAGPPNLCPCLFVCCLNMNVRLLYRQTQNNRVHLLLISQPREHYFFSVYCCVVLGASAFVLRVSTISVQV